MKFFKRFKVTIITTALSLLCLGAVFIAPHVLANTTGWSLKHIEGAPSNVNTDVFYKTSNGISTMFEGRGSTVIKNNGATSVSVLAQFANCGRGGVYANGTFSY